MTAGRGKKGRRLLIIVENLPVPFDRRVWQEATALRKAGYGVSVICPKDKGQCRAYEELDGIHIYRHALPFEASGAAGYLVEYGAALFWEFLLSLRVLRRHGFDAIHACNPPDLIFLVALFHKLVFRKRFIFDHHDICPELYEAKTGRKGAMHRLLRFFERCTFRCADASLATNATFARIAVERGGMPPDRVWVVKSYPDLERFRRVEADPGLKNGRAHLVGYVGIMARQDGVDLLLGAMDRIVRESGRRDVQCLIIGDGPEHANLIALSDALGLGDYVTFSGYLSGGALLTHLSSIDVGAIPDPPNAFNDKVSINKVFEYMALGIPFVQFNLTESASAAGEAALAARDDTPAGLADAILELLDDSARRAAMGAHGVARARRDFRWDTEEAKLLAAYEALLG